MNLAVYCGHIAVLQFFRFVADACLSGLQCRLSFYSVNVCLNVFYPPQHIASLLQTAFSQKRLRDAGDDGAVSVLIVCDLSLEMPVRQLRFSFLSILNYPLWRNALTVLNSPFLCFLCVQRRCFKSKSWVFVSAVGHKYLLWPFLVTRCF